MNRYRPRDFNFRDVLRYLGVEGDKHLHWAVGLALRDLARDRAIEPTRMLTIKTNPNPSVSAPHCIAHYPISLFAAACERVGEMVGDEARQLSMFEVKATEPESRCAT